jgi:tRNA/tmRNA/rRNA uracil-C5-methylase (TrmA/RlmC/RlmD family)
VSPPCPLAHPGGCGGCDFQHVELSEQRALKAAVVSEQLSRLAGLEREVVVEAVPGDQDGLFWRTRMQYVHLPGGDKGLRKHRSHEVVLVDRCLIAHPDAREPDRSGPVVETVDTSFGSHRFTVAGDGFWQVHPGAPRALTETVLGLLAPRPGERALDLYAGVGLFTAYLADAVGPTGSVTAIESDSKAADQAVQNLSGQPQVSVVRDRVDRALNRLRKDPDGGADLVVLDPPRAGAKRQVVRAIADLAPRAVAYVACDPAALARDVAYFAEAGYDLAELRAFDLFPMTHHVECVALLTRR